MLAGLLDFYLPGNSGNNIVGKLFKSLRPKPNEHSLQTPGVQHPHSGGQEAECVLTMMITLTSKHFDLICELII